MIVTQFKEMVETCNHFAFYIINTIYDLTDLYLLVNVLHQGMVIKKNF